jgi:hypothetical protein
LLLVDNDEYYAHTDLLKKNIPQRKKKK